MKGLQRRWAQVREAEAARRLRHWWSTRAARERLALRAAGAALGLLLLWTLALAPPLRSLREVPAERARLDLQWAEMRALATEVERLRASPMPAASSLKGMLEATVQRSWPKAKLVWQGNLALVQLDQPVPTAELTAVLNEVRAGARARVVEAHMQQGAPGLWQGRLAFSLPAPQP